MLVKVALAEPLQSAKKYGIEDKVTSITWERAANNRKAFIDEYIKQTQRGVLSENKKANTYNKIWSPGRKYFGALE